MTALALGDPALTLVTLPHPLGGVDAAALGTRADEAAVQIAGWLTEVAERRKA